VPSNLLDQSMSPHMRKGNHRAGWAKCTKEGLIGVSQSPLGPMSKQYPWYIPSSPPQ